MIPLVKVQKDANFNRRIKFAIYKTYECFVAPTREEKECFQVI